MALGTWVDFGRLDDLGQLDTAAHRIDARAKAFTTLAFIVTVMSFARHEVSALTPYVLYPITLMSLGRIPAGYLFRKVLVAAPFALAIAIFNPCFDRQPAAAIGTFTISGGWLSFASIMVRFALTVSAALVLVACTGMHRLCAGLEWLGLPRVFAMQLLFVHRYLFVIAAEGARMMRSLQLRAASPYRLSLHVYGALVGSLLLRSMDRAGRIYGAMLARGFDGNIRVLNRQAWRWSDAAFAAGWCLFFVVARMWNLADAVGRLLPTGGAS
ncbi:MAG: cobalt ECF transporter T component CbiQ [Lentisphaerae bacterium]|nr:cobalt ECF transporter T component CbiQ [Lentisphaerota bacterium]